MVLYRRSAARGGRGGRERHRPARHRRGRGRGGPAIERNERPVCRHRQSQHISATIETGASVTYTIPYRVTAAPQYDPGTGQSLNAFEAYTNVRLTVTADENIVFKENGENAITVDLDDFSATAPAMKTLSLTAHLKGNGTLPNGTQIGALEVTITADVTVDGETHELSYTLNKNNNTAATSKADNPWKVDKGAPSLRANGENVTVTWTVKAGKEDDANLTGNDSAYNVYGVLNFTGFTLTDELPKVNDKYPTSATIKREGGDSGSYDPSTGKLTISEYATTTVDETHGGSFETPYLSTYTVTATYPPRTSSSPMARMRPTSRTSITASASAIRSLARTLPHGGRHRGGRLRHPHVRRRHHRG